MKIQFIDLKRQYELLKSDIDAQIQTVIDNSSFIMGPQINELEKKLAEHVGVKHAISCASGTDALLLPLLAYDIQPGDEIITTAFSFIATAEVIAFLKAKPVFVDIDPETYNIDSSKIHAAITSRTKGIIAVNIFGQCADFDEINAIARDHGLFVIEDAAQSFGAEYQNRRSCSLADMGCTSFFPAKPLGCYGDGGMIFTNDSKRADVMESIRVHGKGTDKYDNIRIGVNARMDTIQAAIVLAKFKPYADEIQARQRVAKYYSDGLADVVCVPKILNHNRSVFAQYSIRVREREGLINFLKQKQIPTAIHYPKPLHLQTAFAYLGYKADSLPVAEAVCKDILALPMHPYLTKEEQDHIIGSIKEFYQK